METTEFGILYDQKPLSVTGYYKYKAGPEYYDNKEPMPDGKDSMAISAVLYEVESETERGGSGRIHAVRAETQICKNL